MASYFIFSFAQTYQFDALVVQGAIGIVGAGLAFTGAAIKRFGIRT